MKHAALDFLSDLPKKILFLAFVALISVEALAGSRADFAIYNPGLAFADDGVWKEEVAALQKMMSASGWSFEVIGFQEINDQGLIEADGMTLKYSGLVMPGGYSVPRLFSLYPYGKRNIEIYVRAGGGYLGFCAGAFYATQHVEWAEESTDPSGLINLASDYKYYNNYGSPDLFPGRVKGPLGWTPWKIRGVRTPATGLMPVQMNTDLDVMKCIGMPGATLLYYLGGPYFELRSGSAPDNYEVWGRAAGENSESGTSALGEGQPTIVAYGLGKGRVVLFSYHPVILMNGLLAGRQVHEPVVQEGARTDPSPFSAEEVSYQSWNILNAALQKVTGVPVSALPHRARL